MTNLQKFLENATPPKPEDSIDNEIRTSQAMRLALRKWTKLISALKETDKILTSAKANYKVRARSIAWLEKWNKEFAE